MTIDHFMDMDEVDDLGGRPGSVGTVFAAFRGQDSGPCLVRGGTARRRRPAVAAFTADWHAAGR